MDPDIYAALPPDKKEEYKKLFREPNIDPIIQPKICIDDSVPNGYARIGDQYFELPGAQTYTSNIESDVLGAICGSCTTTFIGTKKAQSEIGLSSGEQRLIKKGLKVKNKIPVNIHDAQTCTSEECKPFDIEELRSLFKTWEKLEPETINVYYLLKLAGEMGEYLMRKKIEEDMERRLEDVDKREIRQLWWKLYKSQRIP